MTTTGDAGPGRPTPTPEHLIAEFAEAGQSHRLHVTLLFGQIAVFLAATGGLLYRVTADPPPSSTVLRVLAFFGMLVSVMFLVHHERVYAHSHGARARAIEIQEQLGLGLYRPHKSHVPLLGLNAGRVSRLVYFASVAFWLLVLVFGRRLLT